MFYEISKTQGKSYFWISQSFFTRKLFSNFTSKTKCYISTLFISKKKKKKKKIEEKLPKSKYLTPLNNVNIIGFKSTVTFFS